MRCWIVLLASLLATPAAAEVYVLDSAASRAEFSLRVLWVRRLEGAFSGISGEIERDAMSRGFRVDVRIAADSLTMANPAHAEWARSDEFFAAERHPLIRFRANDVSEQLLHDGGLLQGTLELRGVERAQTLHVEPAGCARPGLDCPIVARAELRRSEFDMDSRRFTIGDRVRLRLAIHLQQ